MIFYFKLGENFQRKARILYGGHTTRIHSSVTYSSMVLHDLVRIMLIVAALNGLDLQAEDIEDAYLTAPCFEKYLMRAGPKFGINEGKVCIVISSLYGLKISSVAFRAFLAEILHNMGFKYSFVDPGVWYREATKSGCEELYKYILVYVGSLLDI